MRTTVTREGDEERHDEAEEGPRGEGGSGTLSSRGAALAAAAALVLGGGLWFFSQSLPFRRFASGEDRESIKARRRRRFWKVASRKTDLYGNWRLVTPNGTLLAFIPDDRAKWYLRKQLGDEIQRKDLLKALRDRMEKEEENTKVTTKVKKRGEGEIAPGKTVLEEGVPEQGVGPKGKEGGKAGKPPSTAASQIAQIEALDSSLRFLRLRFKPIAACPPLGPPRRNICVRCGSGPDFLTRAYIVPRRFRRLFPRRMKSRQHHDIVLLCFHCVELWQRREREENIALALECLVEPRDIHDTRCYVSPERLRCLKAKRRERKEKGARLKRQALERAARRGDDTKRKQQSDPKIDTVEGTQQRRLSDDGRTAKKKKQGRPRLPFAYTVVRTKCAVVEENEKAINDCSTFLDTPRLTKTKESQSIEGAADGRPGKTEKEGVVTSEKPETADDDGPKRDEKEAAPHSDFADISHLVRTFGYAVSENDPTIETLRLSVKPLNVIVEGKVENEGEPGKVKGRPILRSFPISAERVEQFVLRWRTAFIQSVDPQCKLTKKGK